MLRFRDLVLESEVKSFLEYLENEFQVHRRPLYRGSGRDVEHYKVYSPRTDREPSTTSQESQDITVTVGEIFYPTHPNREKSKFGTFNEMTARSYSENTYYFFPHKQVKVSFYDGDTYPVYFDYMNGKYEYIERAFNNMGSDGVHELVAELTGEFDKLAEMIFGLWELEHGRTEFLKETLEDFSDIEDISAHIKSNIREANDKDGHVDKILSSFRKILRRVRKYFEDGKKEYMFGDEVVVEGDYLMVNMKWVDEEIGKHKIWGRDRYSDGPLTNQER